MIDNLNIEAVYNFIVDYKETHDGVSPSIREITDGCALGLTMARYYLQHLEKQGLIKTIPGEARSIQVTGGKWAFAPSGQEPGETVTLSEDPEGGKLALSFTCQNGLVVVGNSVLRQYGTGLTAIMALINLADNLDLEFHRLQSNVRLTGTQQYHLDYMKNVMKMGPK